MQKAVKIKKIIFNLAYQVGQRTPLRRFSPKIQVAIVLGGIAGFVVISWYFIFKNLPNPYSLKNYKAISVSTQILDRNNKLLYNVFREENRKPVKLSSLPKYVPQATIAIEDASFYQHGGISIFGGIARAIKDTLILRKGLQGGSTITQQLVKSALLSPERTIRRKIREVILALWTEQILTKNEILELYLNQVPYGGVSYGIEEAAQSYFEESSKDLSLAQAALLAGLPRAPSAYNPYTNFRRAKARQREVLKRMEELGYINKKDRAKAEKEKLNIKPPSQNIKAPHFVFYVKSILEKEYGTQLVEEGGLRVTTTLDSDIQATAEAAVRQEVEAVKRLKVGNGASLVTRPPTGEILAMVGSVDFFASPSGSFNVTTALRQPGSSIKPLNYATGIDTQKVTAASVFLDVRTCFNAAGQPKPYCPVNYDGTYHGTVALRYALANSYNIPAVKMLALNGMDTFLEYTKRFTITTFKDSSRYGLSLTLGGGEVHMTEMAQAFSAFANEGVPKKLAAILKVEDKNGNVLYEYKDPNFVHSVKKSLNYPNFLAISGQRAIGKDTAFIISHILSDNNARSAAFGTGSKLVVKGHTVSVKTGTTNDLRDNWTIGYTPNFMVVVWVGNNDNSPMSSVASGITGASPIWNRIMSSLLEKQPDLKPRVTNTVVGKNVCTDTGRVAGLGGGCPTRFEYLISGSEDVAGSLNVVRKTVPVSRDTSEMVKEDHPNFEWQEKSVLTDGHSEYCIDCAHPEIPIPTAAP